MKGNEREGLDHKGWNTREREREGGIMEAEREGGRNIAEEYWRERDKERKEYC